MSQAATPFLRISDVQVHFPGRKTLFRQVSEPIRAVDGVSLDIFRGEVLGLVGESGCGKSTLSRAILQLIPITSGSIVLDGVELSRLRGEALRAARLDFQMVFQDPYASLNPRMSVFATLVEALETRGPLGSAHEKSQSVAALMEKVGLEPRFMLKYPHEFSGGQRQRIAIARALAPRPKLLIADEPVSALDVSIQSQILNLLSSLTKEMQLTMLFISHDLGVVRYLADRIAVMQRGKIVELGSAEAVMSQPQHSYTRTLLEAIPRIDLDAVRRRMQA